MTPTPPPSSDDLAGQIVGLYALGEAQILDSVTVILRRAPATLAGIQSALPRIRRVVRQIAVLLAYQSNPLVHLMVTAAVHEGQADAGKAVALLEPHAGAGGSGAGKPPGFELDLSGADPFDLSMPHGQRAAQAIRDDITSELEDVRFRLTRLPDDIYKAIAPHGGMYQVLDNGFTPAQAQAAAWRVFVSQGITGFTDKSGRNWSLSAYTEMAVRTAANRAYNASHLARMHALGIHYFSVPDTGHPCPRCFPWQHAVLTDGPNLNLDVHTDGTIAEATAAGLFHPNCRHTLIPFIPGITELPARQPWTDEQAALYAMTQRQRALERNVREAKKELQYALSPQTRKEAQADIRDAQRKVREFVNAHPELARQSRREQLNLTDAYTKMPPRIS